MQNTFTQKFILMLLISAASAGLFEAYKIFVDGAMTVSRDPHAADAKTIGADPGPRRF